MLEGFNLPPVPPLSILSLLINLGLGASFSLVLRWHFLKFGSTISNRAEFSQIFPFILLTTTLIISIVKSSLALSLGLVGALSIVRFRTPIKEPEELAYLFMAISMGLGFGADQRLPTLVAGSAILGLLAILKQYKKDDINKNLYLTIDLEESSDEYGRLELINSIILKHVKDAELRRFETQRNDTGATYHIDIMNTANLSILSDDLKRSLPGASITFIDQNRLPSI
jgi:hypothetical protein